MRAGERQTDLDRIVFWGWMLAAGSLLLIGLLGIGSLILGGIAVSKGRVGAGVAIIVATLVFATVNIVVWNAVLGSDEPATVQRTDTDGDGVYDELDQAPYDPASF